MCVCVCVCVFVCVCVALITQYEKRTRRIKLPSVASHAVPYFSRLSHKANQISDMIFSAMFVGNISQFQKNSER